MRHAAALLVLRSVLLLSTSWTSKGSSASPPKFTTSGPVLSVTLRDPRSSTANSGGNNAGTSGTARRASSSSNNKSDASLHITSLSNVDPCCTWSIQSNGPPFPRRFPSIQSISAALSYQYSVLKALPSTISGKLNLGGFFNDRLKIQIQPSLQVKSGIKDLNIHVSTENEDHMAWVQASSSIGGLVSPSCSDMFKEICTAICTLIIMHLLLTFLMPYFWDGFYG
jgi:hypothetical protein